MAIGGVVAGPSLGRRDFMRVYNDSAQSIAPSTTTVVDMDTLDGSDGGFTQGANGGVVVPQTRLYDVSAAVKLDSINDTVYFVIEIYDITNSVQKAKGNLVKYGASGDAALGIGSVPVWLEADTEIGVRVAHNHPANRNTETGSVQTWLDVQGAHV